VEEPFRRYQAIVSHDHLMAGDVECRIPDGATNTLVQLGLLREMETEES